MTTQNLTPAAELSNYTIHFARIGRNHNVAPLDLLAADADGIAAQVHQYARRFLLSTDVEISVDLEQGKGFIRCGWHNGGSFTIARAINGGAR